MRSSAASHQAHMCFVCFANQGCSPPMLHHRKCLATRCWSCPRWRIASLHGSIVNASWVDCRLHPPLYMSCSLPNPYFAELRHVVSSLVGPRGHYSLYCHSIITRQSECKPERRCGQPPRSSCPSLNSHNAHCLYVSWSVPRAAIF